MPRKPLRKKGRIGQDSLTIGALEQLLLGYDPFFCKPLTDEELRAEYDRHRGFIMSLIGQDLIKIIPGWFLRPVPIPWGTRPACWWQFEATEGRRMIGGDRRNIWPGSPLWLGVPKLYTKANHGCEFESQPDYLRRYGLLMPGEANKIKPKLIDR